MSRVLNTNSKRPSTPQPYIQATTSISGYFSKTYLNSKAGAFFFSCHINSGTSGLILFPYCTQFSELHYNDDIKMACSGNLCFGLFILKTRPSRIYVLKQRQLLKSTRYLWLKEQLKETQYEEVETRQAEQPFVIIQLC